MPSGRPSQPTVGGASAAGFVTHSLSEVSEGMKIEHPKFGMGVITEISRNGADSRIKVEFGVSAEERILMLKFAKFAISTEK